tara:strand:- start:76 stop:273 length:198 start_codon:yes stop_codon:yes gene_type:complete
VVVEVVTGAAESTSIAVDLVVGAEEIMVIPQVAGLERLDKDLREEGWPMSQESRAAVAVVLVVLG